MPALVVAACLVALAGLRAWQLLRAQEALQKSRALQLAVLSARGLDATIASTHTLLASLGELLDPRASAEQNDSTLRRIYRSAPVPYANLWVSDSLGGMRGSARATPVNRPTYTIADRGYFQRAISGRRFAVGDFIRSQTVPGNPNVLTFALPVIDQVTKRIKLVVCASIEADSIDALRTVRSMPEGSVLTIIDSSGTVVFRTSDFAGWVGRKFAVRMGKIDDFGEGQGVGSGRSADGTFRLTGFATTQRAPWALYIGVPAQYTLGVVRTAFIRDVVIGALITLILLAFGYRSTLRVVAPIESLTADAKAIADGDLHRRSLVDTDDELGELARAFNRMADTAIERNEALRSSKEQLLHVQKMEALGSFAGGIAHDFNNYLASIVAHAELAELSINDTESVRADLHEVLESAARAADLTKQILVFSRKQAVERSVLDINDVVRGIERMLTSLIGDARTLAVEYADAPVFVLADYGQLEQVIVNLVANARDAMPDGGTVRLRTDTIRASAAGQSPAAAPVEGYARLVVTDEGVGMNGELLERIFDPFFSTKARGRGTGLGLAIAYSIVEQSGGTLSATSVVGEGTTFTMLLPLQPDGDPEEVIRDAVRPAEHASGHILLAEDDAGVRTSTARILVKAGYSVVAAQSGTAALQALRSTGAHFDLLLSDVVMPGMSGSELARLVRAAQPDIALLYMSGYADDKIVLDAVASSGAACLAKPFTMNALLAAVRSALSEQAVTPAT